MGGVCCPCWPSHEYTEIPATDPVCEVVAQKKKKDYHVAFQNENTIASERIYPSPASNITQQVSTTSISSNVLDSLSHLNKNHIEESKSPVIHESSPQESPKVNSLPDIDNPDPKEVEILLDELLVDIPQASSKELNLRVDTNDQQQPIASPTVEIEPPKSSNSEPEQVKIQNEEPLTQILRQDEAVCSKCGRVKRQGDFSKNQWKKKTLGQPAKCQECVNRGG